MYVSVYIRELPAWQRPEFSVPETVKPRAGEFYGSIRAALAAEGGIIGNNDLWIAAHAKAAGLILVTNNEREFRRIQELEIENWAD